MSTNATYYYEFTEITVLKELINWMTYEVENVPIHVALAHEL